MVATTTTTEHESGSKIHVVKTYPHPRAKVWEAIADADKLGKWLMVPEGYAPVVGTRFILRAPPGAKGWRGFVDCEVLAVEPGRMLRFSWCGDPGKVQVVTFTLDDDGAGTRFTLDHAGFHGAGGFVLAKFILGPGWRNKILVRLADVLASR